MNVETIISAHKIAEKTYLVGDKEYNKYRIQIPYKKGKRKDITADSVEELKIKIQEFINGLSVGYEELIKRFLNDEKYLKMMPKSYPSSINRSAKRFIPYFKNQPIDLIDDLMIQKACSEIKKGNLSYKSIHLMMMDMLHLFDYALIKDYISINPFRGTIPKNKENHFERYYLNEQEIVEFIDMSHRSYLGNIFILCLLAGIPPKKLLAVSWRDIDFENNKISINKAFKSTASEDIKKLGARDIYDSYQPQYVMDVLKDELVEQSKDNKISIDILKNSTKPILSYILSKHNCYIANFAPKINYFIKHTLKKKYRFADVLFTSAVIAIKAGCDMTHVSEIVGMSKAFEMFKNLRKYNRYYQTENNGVCQYFDEQLYKTKKLVIDTKENEITALA